MSLDQQYYTTILNNAVYFYQLSSGQYKFITKIYPLCMASSCTLDFQYLSDDASKLIVYSSSDALFKIYTISNLAFYFLQTIPFDNHSSICRPRTTG